MIGVIVNLNSPLLLCLTEFRFSVGQATLVYPYVTQCGRHCATPRLTFSAESGSPIVNNQSWAIFPSKSLFNSMHVEHGGIVVSVSDRYSSQLVFDSRCDENKIWSLSTRNTIANQRLVFQPSTTFLLSCSTLNCGSCIPVREIYVHTHHRNIQMNTDQSSDW